MSTLKVLLQMKWRWNSQTLCRAIQSNDSLPATRRGSGEGIQMLDIRMTRLRWNRLFEPLVEWQTWALLWKRILILDFLFHQNEIIFTKYVQWMTSEPTADAEPTTLSASQLYSPSSLMFTFSRTKLLSSKMWTRSARNRKQMDNFRTR